MTAGKRNAHLSIGPVVVNGVIESDRTSLERSSNSMGGHSV
jgi:hypothetical protein